MLGQRIRWRWEDAPRVRTWGAFQSGQRLSSWSGKRVFQEGRSARRRRVRREESRRRLHDLPRVMLYCQPHHAGPARSAWKLDKASIASCTKDSTISILIRATSSSGRTSRHSIRLALTSCRLCNSEPIESSEQGITVNLSKIATRCFVAGAVPEPPILWKQKQFQSLSSS